MQEPDMTDHSLQRRSQQPERKLVNRVYRATEMVFLTMGLSFAGIALLLIPQAVQRQSAAEIARVQQVAQENREICEKWGLKLRTPEHVACTLDLDEVRARQDRETASRMMGLL
jgi:hypothetical protein